MSHTPGPWEHERHSCDCNDKTGAIVPGYNINGPEPLGDMECGAFTEADARLMAAAPDLLDALHGILKLIGDGQLRRNTSEDGEPDWAIRQMPFVLALGKAAEAIEKAEG